MVEKDFVNSLGQSPDYASCYRALIDYLCLGQWLIFVDANGFARGQGYYFAPHREVLHINQTFFDAYFGDIAIVFHLHVKDGATHGDKSGRRVYAIVVGLSAQFLNVDPDVAQPDVKQVFPVALAGAELHVRVGVDFECAAIGELEKGAAGRSGDDHLAGLDAVADV